MHDARDPGGSLSTGRPAHYVYAYPCILGIPLPAHTLLVGLIEGALYLALFGKFVANELYAGGGNPGEPWHTGQTRVYRNQCRVPGEWVHTTAFCPGLFDSACSECTYIEYYLYVSSRAHTRMLFGTRYAFGYLDICMQPCSCCTHTLGDCWRRTASTTTRTAKRTAPTQTALGIAASDTGVTS